MWRDSESADIEQLLHQIVWFCGGRHVRGEVDLDVDIGVENPDATGV